MMSLVISRNASRPSLPKRRRRHRDGIRRLRFVAITIVAATLDRSSRYFIQVRKFPPYANLLLPKRCSFKPKLITKMLQRLFRLFWSGKKEREGILPQTSPIEKEAEIPPHSKRVDSQSESSPPPPDDSKFQPPSKTAPASLPPPIDPNLCRFRIKALVPRHYLSRDKTSISSEDSDQLLEQRADALLETAVKEVAEKVGMEYWDYLCEESKKSRGMMVINKSSKRQYINGEIEHFMYHMTPETKSEIRHELLRQLHEQRVLMIGLWGRGQKRCALPDGIADLVSAIRAQTSARQMLIHEERAVQAGLWDAYTLIESFGENGQESLRGLLNHPSFEVRRYMALHFASKGDDSAIQVLEEYVEAVENGIHRPSRQISSCRERLLRASDTGGVIWEDLVHARFELQVAQRFDATSPIKPPAALDSKIWFGDAATRKAPFGSKDFRLHDVKNLPIENWTHAITSTPTQMWACVLPVSSLDSIIQTLFETMETVHAISASSAVDLFTSHLMAVCPQCLGGVPGKTLHMTKLIKSSESVIVLGDAASFQRLSEGMCPFCPSNVFHYIWLGDQMR